MTLVLAIIAYLIVYIAVAWVSEKYGPVVGIGGLMLVLFVAHCAQ